MKPGTCHLVNTVNRLTDEELAILCDGTNADKEVEKLLNERANRMKTVLVRGTSPDEDDPEEDNAGEDKEA